MTAKELISVLGKIPEDAEIFMMCDSGCRTEEIVGTVLTEVLDEEDCYKLSLVLLDDSSKWQMKEESDEGGAE